MLSVDWISRTYSQDVKYYFCHRPFDKRSLTQWNYLWLAYSVYEVLRENITAYSLYSGDYRFFAFDLVAEQFSQNTKFPEFFFVAFGGLAFFYFWLLCALHYSNLLDYTIMYHLQEIIIGNWTDFWASNAELKFKFSQSIRHLRKIFSILKKAEIHFKSKFTGNLALLSEKNRFQLLLNQLTNEVFQAMITAVTVVCLALGTVFYCTLSYRAYSLPGFLFFTTHMITQAALNLHCIKLGFFSVFTLKVFCFVYRLLFRQVTDSIKTLRRHSVNVSSPARTFDRLLSLQVSHNRLVAFILHLNCTFISPLLFTVCLVVCPTNVYMITYITLHPLNWINELFIVTIMVFQFTALFLLIVPMIQLRSSVSPFGCSLISLLASHPTTSKNLPLIRLKLKLSTFYEQAVLHETTFTVGSLGPVSANSVYKVSKKSRIQGIEKIN